jgi:hypothetical protein
MARDASLPQTISIISWDCRDGCSEFQELSVSPQSWQLLAWSTTPAGAAVRSNGFFFVLYCLQPRLLPFIATFQIFHSPGFKFLHELSSDSRFDNSVSWILVWNWSIHHVYESEWVMSLCIHSKHERQNDDVLTQPFAMCVYFWIVKNHHMWWGNEFLNRGLWLLPKFMTFCYSWNPRFDHVSVFFTFLFQPLFLLLSSLQLPFVFTDFRIQRTGSHMDDIQSIQKTVKTWLNIQTWPLRKTASLYVYNIL